MLNAEDRQNHLCEERKKEEEEEVEAEKNINVGNQATIHSLTQCATFYWFSFALGCVCVSVWVPRPISGPDSSVKLSQNKCFSRSSSYSLTGCECCANELMCQNRCDFSSHFVYDFVLYIILFFPCLRLCSMSNGRCSSHFRSRRKRI